MNALEITTPVIPFVVLREIDGWTICDTNKSDKVAVYAPGEPGRDFHGYHNGIIAASEYIRDRIIRIKRNERRIKGERTVVSRVIKDLLAAGFSLSVDDGEEVTVKKSTKFKEVSGAMMTTDEDRLWAHKDGKRACVYFVYGNSAYEVICDYHLSLEPHLQGAFGVCARLERQGI